MAKRGKSSKSSKARKGLKMKDLGAGKKAHSVKGGGGGVPGLTTGTTSLSRVGAVGPCFRPLGVIGPCDRPR